jgi:hypothetical protein
MLCTPIWLIARLSTPTSWISQALIHLCFFCPTVSTLIYSFLGGSLSRNPCPIHTRSLTKLPPINRYYPLVPMPSSTSPSRSNSSTPAVNPLGVNYYDWGRRQPDRSPLSRLRHLTPIHQSQKPHSRRPCLVPSSSVHGWISTSRETCTGRTNPWS